MRKTTIFLLMVLVLSSVAFAQAITEVPEDAYRGYKSLDPASGEKIYFDGYTVKWGGKTFSLDENTFFLDSRLEDSYVETNPYVFNDALKALATVNSGTADKPMMLLVAPGVYWVDDPDSDVIRTATNGPSKSGTPVGAVVTCDYLWFYGLNSNPYNVVFAVNRGQQAGAEGNFTMFAISGVGLRSDNVTFGNYCNVDLVYDLDPSLSRAKRSDAITQAQLFSYGGGDGIAVNTNFISRLNLSQFAKYFYNCHLESGGHAGGGYYVNCDFLLCNANFGGANMFNCDVTFDSYDHLWKGKTEFDFNLVDGKGNGLILVDTRFYRGKNLVDNNVNINLTWDNAPQTYTTRAYQYNVTLDGQPVVFQEMYTPGASVVVTDGSDLAKAFVVECNGERVYNLKNITGFDPFGGEEKIKAAAKAAGLAEDAYFSIPTKINVALDVDTIQSGSDVATLTYAFASYPETEGTWSFAVKDPVLASYVSLKDNGDGTVTVEGTNSTEDACKVLIEATHSLGLKAAVELVATPSFIEAPAFTQAPSLGDYENGAVTLNYALDLGHKDRVDQSVINWYRVKDENGSEPFAVSVTRLDNPETSYVLSPGDVGYYIMATIQPKHQRCYPGEMVSVVSSRAVTADDVKFEYLETDFQNLPIEDQPVLIPGTWSLDGFSPVECVKKPFEAKTSGNFVFVEGKGGAAGYTSMVHGTQGSRLFYLPVGESFGNMKVQASFAPYKDAGQGFGSATDQFLDIFIKFDRETMTGYAFRVQRLSADDVTAIGQNPKGAATACAVSLVEYKDGVTKHISERVMTSAFMAVSNISLEAKDGVLTGYIYSTLEGARGGDGSGYAREVTLTAPYEENGFGGTGAICTGTSNPTLGTNCNYIMFLNWKTLWD